MDNNNHVTFKKIPLSVLISALHEAWNAGAEYIDLAGTPDTEQDYISIIVKKEYIDSEDDNDEDISFTIGPGPITDDDLNLLSGM
jgi:hypothetical protein